MTERVLPDILCGGSGSRLWQLSRADLPKQFLCLASAESLFKQTAKRLVDLGCFGEVVAKPMLVPGEVHCILVAEQLREGGIEMSAAHEGRNASCGLALAALAANADGLNLVMDCKE